MKRKVLFLLTALSVVMQMMSVTRETETLTGEWQFVKGDAVTGDVAEWRSVTIPHTWNAEDGCSPKYYRGNGTYRCTFNAPQGYGKGRVFVRFEGVSLVADVYCNGKYLGNHKGAFSAFCFEITDVLKRRGNELVVKVNNEKNLEVIPMAGDFTKFGGIYRKVSLIVLPNVCISPLDYASSGVYVSQTKVCDTEAELEVTAVVDFGKEKPAMCDIQTSVFDDENKEVAVDVSKNTMVKDFDGRILLKQYVNISNPTLWQGLENPYLYKFRISLKKNGKVIDAVEQNIGLRYFSVDHRKGFFLNGKPYNLRGVNRHQDRKGKGWAISEDDQREDFGFIREIGANAVRLAHYPQTEMVYDMCDKAGVLAWSEIPFIERGNDGSKAFAENTKRQLVEMIRQNYNHPSVFCWGLFNELGEGHPETLVWQLNELAHLEDPTRYTVAASNHDNRPDNYYTDIMAYNTYPGWYWADPETMRYAVDWKYKPENKQPGLAVSEYGAGASVRQHENNVKKPNPGGKWHPEEWQAVCHEGNYAEIAKREWLWGSFVWNLFDFASATRTEGDTDGINDKGLVTYDRKVRKDAFYFYKAQWSKSPMVHICSKRYIDRTDADTEIKVYSNCDAVEVTLNGKLLDGVKPNLNVYVWKNVTLQKGENLVSVKAVRNGKTVEDKCVWNLK